jgi:mono/diheme cytochrome c family protein
MPTPWSRSFWTAAVVSGVALWSGGVLSAHDIITTPITWDREISRIVYARCATCHQDGGSAFSLMTYDKARPWAVAIKEEVLNRRMPPWGAVKGFGEFRNDTGLTMEQLELVVNWVEGGVPEGDAKDLPQNPKLAHAAPNPHPTGEILVTGDYTLAHAFRLDGIRPRSVSKGSTFQISAERPDGSIEPLLWLYQFDPRFIHPYLLREPLDLPAGTRIHGVPAGASVALLPATSVPQQEHQSAPYSPPRSAGTGPTPGSSVPAENKH